MKREKWTAARWEVRGGFFVVGEEKGRAAAGRRGMDCGASYAERRI